VTFLSQPDGDQVATRNFGNFQDESRGLSAVEISCRARNKKRYAMILLIRLSKMLAGPIRNPKPKKRIQFLPIAPLLRSARCFRFPTISFESRRHPVLAVWFDLILNEG
jgi:hypothetical protein